MMNGKYKYPHQYFFSSLTTLTPQQQEEFNIQNKIRYIADTLPYYTNEQSSDLLPERALDAKIYGQIAHPEFITPIATLGDIPQLPKLFRSRMHSTTLLNTTDRLLLPYLCSYIDMFIEHPLETEKLLVDDTVPSIGGDVMGSVMWHIVTHTMRTRYVTYNIYCIYLFCNCCYIYYDTYTCLSYHAYICVYMHSMPTTMYHTA